MRNEFSSLWRNDFLENYYEGLVTDCTRVQTTRIIEGAEQYDAPAPRRSAQRTFHRHSFGFKSIFTYRTECKTKQHNADGSTSLRHVCAKLFYR